MTTAPTVLKVTAESTGPTNGLDASAFSLDISVIEQGDLGGLVRLTDDNCGSTCGACTTG